MISLCTSGKADIYAEDFSACSRPGSILFIPQGLDYISDINETREIIAIHFKATGTLPQKPQIIIPSFDKSITAEFSHMADLFASPRPTDHLACMSRVYHLMEKIFNGQEFRAAGTGFDKRLLPAIEYIHAHYASAQATDVEYLASLCGFTSAYLRRLFAREYGVPTSTYIKLYRISQAKSLLATGYYSVTEVATSCGFDSPSYFSKEFRKHTGLTPQAFARSNYQD